ncbi:hypothetical protein [Streptomyces sp. NBC_01314]|uniref:hypothetical protein n=1 Tax=Streptomyces sp. NBC_01314 TaxID=2903821 RepID=UPI00309215B3|nr:hypothetical protein OG622_32560 [Streptomyces sp. NBC_01314]
MNKLKKVAAVAAMVGGLGLAGGGVASANGGEYSDPFPFADNLQITDCRSSTDVTQIVSIPINVSVGGDASQAFGNNLCQPIGSID